LEPQKVPIYRRPLELNAFLRASRAVIFFCGSVQPFDAEAFALRVSV
jgi:hypothetical protein